MGGVESPEGDSIVWITDRSSQPVWDQEAQDVVKALECGGSDNMRYTAQAGVSDNRYGYLV